MTCESVVLDPQDKGKREDSGSGPAKVSRCKL